LADRRTTIADPTSRFGFQPGTDRKLIRWDDMLSYFQDIAHISNRVKYEKLGTVSGGLPFVMLTISSPENLARLGEYQDIQKRLADPRDRTESEINELIDKGRTVVLLTCSVHATEVGSTQMTPALVYEIATRDDPEMTRILESVILLLLPSLNPWGMELVHDWYEKTLDTPSEGTYPPELYHPYTGHDNNRDWFMLTQIETRITVEKIHNVWHPHIVFDQHQMMPDGPRYVLPPFVDPYDSNVDPILQAEIAQMGSTIAAELTAAGMKGVATQVMFDAYSPSRAYQHYHGGVRILSEAASCRIATPVELEPQEIREARGFDPNQRRANNPIPWEGGEWRLSDIVECNILSAYACLRNAAAYREQWVRNFYKVQRNSVDIVKPFAYVVPAEQVDPGAVLDMLQVLNNGLVEIHQATAPFQATGVEHPAGTYVIRIGQPFGRYAKTLLETQHYPDLRDDPNSPPKTPYDITAHCLPLYLGVESVEAADPFDADLKLLNTDDLQAPTATVTGRGKHGWVIDARRNRSIVAVNRLLAAGAPVFRAAEEFADGANEWPPGTFVVDLDDDRLLTTVAEDTGVDIRGLESDPEVPLQPLRRPRIGLYRSWLNNAMDEGWTRFVLEGYEFAFTTLRDQDIRQGGLYRRFDVMVLPHQSTDDIMFGNSSVDYPTEYSGGIGERGAANLRRFAESGGTLVALDGASEVAVRHLYLPVINPVETLSEQQFYAPGAMLQMLVDPRHPIAYGYEREVAGLVTGRHAFSPIGTEEVRQVARYPANNQLLSGWIIGAEHIRGAASLVDIPVQDGRAILFGFRPQFRAQTRGTYRLLFNALYYSAMDEPASQEWSLRS
jgi:hypothetical protein